MEAEEEAGREEVPVRWEEDGAVSRSVGKRGEGGRRGSREENVWEGRKEGRDTTVVQM